MVPAVRGSHSHAPPRCWSAPAAQRSPDTLRSPSRSPGRPISPARCWAPNPRLPRCDPSSPEHTHTRKTSAVCRVTQQPAINLTQLTHQSPVFQFYLHFSVLIGHVLNNGLRQHLDALCQGLKVRRITQCSTL